MPDTPSQAAWRRLGIANGFIVDETDSADGFAFLQRTLEDYGLGELFTWAKDQIIAGHSTDWVLLELRNQPAFKARFRLIEERQKAGLSPMSPDEVIAYETQVRQLMRAAGMPAGFYDQPDDFVQLGARDLSISEIADRVNEVYLAVAGAHQSVRDAFTSMFGPSGDAALAAMVMDPDRALPALVQYVGAAQFKGAGSRFGFDIDRGMALEAAALGLGQQAGQGFQQLAQIRPIFEETVGEVIGGEDDLVAEDEGVDLVFGLGGGAGAEKVRERKDRRTAAFQGNSGFQSSRGGVSALGSAD